MSKPLFHVDLSKVQDIYQLDRSQMDGFRNMVVGRLAQRYVRDVIAMANSELRQTRSEYVRSISVDNPSVGVAIVELNGMLPNMLEHGASPFDMKEGFMHSSKVHQKLDGGWYLTIPFGHATPFTTGDFSTLGDPMPTEVYEKVKDLPAGRSLADDGDLPRLGARERIVTEGRVFDAYMRKHSPYEGIQKSTRENHSSYTSFRRVSDKSDPNSWIYTGLTARNFFGRAYNEHRLMHEVDIARDIFIDSL